MQLTRKTEGPGVPAGVNTVILTVCVFHQNSKTKMYQTQTEQTLVHEHVAP